MLEINIPDVVAEVREAWLRYNRALGDNDVATMNELFWESPHTVRYGYAENLYGHDEIARYRAAQTGRRDRSLGRHVITTFGRDLAYTWTETRTAGSDRAGRQTQVWVRAAEGWRIAAAHVSHMDAPGKA
jgi:ketosteroid isomerase-like protein